MTTKFEKFLEENKDTWKTKAAFMAWLRGGIRRSCWNNAPPKTKFIKENRKQIDNPNLKGKKLTVWGGTCSICKQDFALSGLQIDHVNEGVSTLKDLCDVEDFIGDIVIALQDELRFCCKSCHEISSHAQKHGYSFEEAKIRKEHILIVKEKRLDQELVVRGVTELPKTIKAKSELLLNLMLEEVK